MSTSKKGPTPDDQKIKEQGNKSLDELSSDYAGKSVELELIREVSEAMEKRLEGRKKDFVEEKEKLENIHQQIWGSIDAFCDSIWKFSADHDVPGVINNYLDRPSRISSKKAVEDPEKIQYLNYQISLLTEEIKTLRENIEALDSEKKSAELKVPDDKKPNFPLRESQNNNQESMNFSMNRKKVAFQDEKKIPELQQPLEFENSPELREKCQKIELKPKSSTFSVKRKSKICENFERNLWTK